jgi:hypothetical protein
MHDITQGIKKHACKNFEKYSYLEFIFSVEKKIQIDTISNSRALSRIVPTNLRHLSLYL